jgi:hypothetical protein
MIKAIIFLMSNNLFVNENTSGQIELVEMKKILPEDIMREIGTYVPIKNSNYEMSCKATYSKERIEKRKAIEDKKDKKLKYIQPETCFRHCDTTIGNLCMINYGQYLESEIIFANIQGVEGCVV